MTFQTSPSTPDRITVDVWSDIMCPFCYIGDTVLADAIDGFDHDVEVRYHSFLLMPDLVSGEAATTAELLETRRGMPRDQVEAMNAQVTERAAEVGLEYRLDRAVPSNTRAAHRLTHHAAQHGLQHAMVQRLFAAHFTEGRDVDDVDVLVELAADVGLDPQSARTALEDLAHDDAVDADIDLAQQLGVTGVPFFVFDQTYALSGAQPVEAFNQALDTAWQAKTNGSA